MESSAIIRIGCDVLPARHQLHQRHYPDHRHRCADCTSMRVGQELRARGFRMLCEDSMCAGIAGDGSVEIVGSRCGLGLVALLLVVSDAGEVAIEEAGSEGVGDDGLRGSPSDI